MAAVDLAVDVSHSQIAVFLSSMSQPFNDWTQEHVDQGFAWRPGSVSFRTMAEFGLHAVRLEVVDSFDEIGDDVSRAIEVPFEVPVDGAVEVASISDGAALSLPSGKYCLRCEFIDNRAGGQVVKLTFAKGELGRFLLARIDGELKAPSVLKTTAEPAAA